MAETPLILRSLALMLGMVFSRFNAVYRVFNHTIKHTTKCAVYLVLKASGRIFRMAFDFLGYSFAMCLAAGCPTLNREQKLRWRTSMNYIFPEINSYTLDFIYVLFKVKHYHWTVVVFLIN
jgi:hypothetical protein